MSGKQTGSTFCWSSTILIVANRSGPTIVRTNQYKYQIRPSENDPKQTDIFSLFCGKWFKYKIVWKWSKGTFVPKTNISSVCFVENDPNIKYDGLKMIWSGQIYLVCFVENDADTSRALAPTRVHSVTSMSTNGQHLYGPLYHANTLIWPFISFQYIYVIIFII